MITIIAKKIDAKLSGGESNYTRMQNLAHYCANPQSKHETEKCVAVQALNFSDDHPSMDRVIDELTFDMMKAKRQDAELISHWVISWKGGEPDVNKIFESAKSLLEDLGYTEANRALLAIHADTQHIHCHIAVCKVDMWNGKIAREAWYKNESQKSLARIADKHGWGLEPNARFRVVPGARMERLTVKTTQGPRQIMRRHVTKCERKKPSIAAGAKKYEHRTGLKSTQRQLQERLGNFLNQNKSEMRMWKFGNFHRELAYQGIECRRVERKGKFYTSFSLDGKNYFTASKVCPSLSYDKLSSLLGNRSWRDSRLDLEEIRNTAREQHQKELELTSQAPFTREEIKRLKEIPAEEVYKALGKKMKPGEAKDAFDILSSAGFSAPEAAKWLAEKFPKDGRKVEIPFNEMLAQVKSQGVKIAPKDLPRARKIAEFMGAMHTDKIKIFTSPIDPDLAEKASESGDELREITSKPITLSQVCKLLPQIEKLEKYDVKLSCRPVWEDAKPAIIASDQNTYYAAPDEYKLPGAYASEPMTLTILAHGGKANVKVELDASSLKEIPAKDLKDHLQEQRQAPEPAPVSEKAAYRPYEPEKEALSKALLELYEQEQKKLLDRFLNDRQRAWALAGALYEAGATPGQVYTALGADAEAKELAMRQMPVAFTGSTSEWQRKRSAQKPTPTLAPVDFDQDRQIGIKTSMKAEIQQQKIKTRG